MVRDRATEPTEMEITPAMIEAGVMDYCLWENGDRPELIVISIFQTMLEASRLSQKKLEAPLELLLLS